MTSAPLLPMQLRLLRQARGSAGHQRHLSIQPEFIKNHSLKIFKSGYSGVPFVVLRKSRRNGVKISTSTTSSSIIVAPCQHFDGKCRTSPATATFSFPSTKNLTLPFRQSSFARAVVMLGRNDEWRKAKPANHQALPHNHLTLNPLIEFFNGIAAQFRCW